MSTSASPARVPRTGPRPPVIGYGGHRLLLAAPTLAPPLGEGGFLNVATAVGHLTALAEQTTEHDGLVWRRDYRRAVAQRISTAHSTVLSRGGGLLAYRCGAPLRWFVVHIRSGRHLPVPSDHDARTMTLIESASHPGSDLSPGGIRAYLAALDGLVDPRGVQIDWTAPWEELRTPLGRLQDYGLTGVLPEPDSRSEDDFGGLAGLHTAAVLHALRRAPLSTLRSRTANVVVDALATCDTPWGVRGRDATPTLRFLLAFSRQLSPYRSRTRDRHAALTAEERARRVESYRVLQLARLLTIGGEPHRAVEHLRTEAARLHALPGDSEALSRIARGLTEAASAVAELFTPVFSEGERLLRAQPGARLIFVDPGRATVSTPLPHQVWTVTGYPRLMWSGPRTGTDAMDIPAREHRSQAECTIRIEGRGCVMLIAATGRCTDILTTAGRWLVLDPTDPLPADSAELTALLGRTVAAFDRDAPSAPEAPSTEQTG